MNDFQLENPKINSKKKRIRYLSIMDFLNHYFDVIYGID